MDEAFMLRVKERIAAATRSVAAQSPSADSANLPILQNLEKWMATYCPDAERRCAECHAPLVKGVTRICVACGCFLSSGSRFAESLATQPARKASHLEYGEGAAPNSSKRQLQQPASSGMQTSADQQSFPSTSTGVGSEAGQTYTGQQDRNLVGEASAPVARLEGRSLSFKLWKKETKEENTGGFCETDAGASVSSRPVSDISSSYSAKEFGGEGETFDCHDSLGAAPDSTVDARHPVGEVEIGDFFDAVSKPASHLQTGSPISGGEIVTSDLDDIFSFPQKSVDRDQGPNLQLLAPPPPAKKASGDFVTAFFDGFFGGGRPIQNEQSFGQNGGMASPIAVKTSNGQTEEADFYDFFQAASSSTDQNGEISVGQKLGTGFGFFQASSTSAGQSRSQVGEPSFKDFFGAPSRATEQSHGQGGASDATFGRESAVPDIGDFFQFSPVPSRGATVPSSANNFPENPGQAVETEFDDFFQAVPSSAKISRGGDFTASASGATQESSDHTSELNFGDFFKDATSAAGQNEEPTARSAEGVVDHAKETDFHNSVTSASRPPDTSHGQGATLGFDNFFQADNSSGHDAQTDFEFEDFVQAAPQSEKAFDTKLSTDFGDFFQAAPQSSDESIVQKQESPSASFRDAPESVDASSALCDPIEFDNFFQVPPKPTDESHRQNGSFFDAAPRPGDKSLSQNLTTEFDGFFQAPPEKREDAERPNGAAGLHSPSDKSRATQNGAVATRVNASLVQDKGGADDLFSQLDGLSLSDTVEMPKHSPLKATQKELPDLKVMRGDHLVFSDEVSVERW